MVRRGGAGGVKSIEWAIRIWACRKLDHRLMLLGQHSIQCLCSVRGWSVDDYSPPTLQKEEELIVVDSDINWEHYGDKVVFFRDGRWIANVPVPAKKR